VRDILFTTWFGDVKGRQAIVLLHAETLLVPQREPRSKNSAIKSAKPALQNLDLTVVAIHQQPKHEGSQQTRSKM